MYLQSWDPFAGGCGVVPKGTFLVQEATLATFDSRLEQPIVQHISQSLGQCAQDLLLGNPHCGVLLKPHTLLLQNRDKNKHADFSLIGTSKPQQQMDPGKQ